MAKDPAFLFYPGDYLRDTQCLSEKSQVAYDRIMCEHMRNICISQEQLNFFTKRLNEDEKAELMFLLVKKDSGYQIEWVAESICKRISYSKSRAKNRIGKTKEDMLTYDKHMVNEIEIENVIKNKDEFKEKKDEIFIFKKPIYPNENDLGLELPSLKKNLAVQYFKSAKKIDVDIGTVDGLWAVFKGKTFTGSNQYKDENEIFTHFINTLKNEKIENGIGNNKGDVKLSPSAARNLARRTY